MGGRSGVLYVWKGGEVRKRVVEVVLNSAFFRALCMFLCFFTRDHSKKKMAKTKTNFTISIKRRRKSKMSTLFEAGKEDSL